MDQFGEVDLSYEKPDNLVEFFERSVKKYPKNKLFGEKNSQGQYEWSTYEEIYKRVQRIRGALAFFGIKANDAVGIISNNRSEWFICENATHGLRARWVPMYEKELLSMWKYVVKDAAIKILFVSKPEIYEKVKSFIDEIQTLERIILIEGSQSQENSLLWLEKIGEEHPKDVEYPDANDIAELIYTSGTTGEPKGVLLTHGNLTSNSLAGCHKFPELDQYKRTLSMLPWAHSYGLTAELHTVVYLGASMGIMESIDTLADDFLAIRPTHLMTVPRVFNKIYEGIFAKMEEEGGIVQKLFNMAVAEARKRLETGKTSFKFKILDKIVLKKIRAKFGGRLMSSLTASAKMDIEISKFFFSIGLPVYDCYGMTECSPAITMNSPDEYRLGSIGKPIEKTLVYIDKSRVGEDSKDGEIICFGPQVMQGYHNKPEKTAEVLVEIEGIPGKGMRTGDRGWLDKDGFLYITGRFKEEYKLENGKYVHPAAIEESLKLLPYVANAFVYGDGKPYNVAIIIPNFEFLHKLSKELKLSIPIDLLLENKEFLALVEKEMQNHLRKKFGGYEIPRKFMYLKEDFTLENGMLTQTLKLKRSKVMEKYGDKILALYN